MSERTIELQKSHRLYNAGERISEKLHYTIPGTEPFNAVAGWMLEAPERDFFTIPEVLIIGDARVYPRFAELVLRDDRFGARGVVLVDANWKEPEDEEAASKIPIATNDKAAIAKAGVILERYERSCIQAWVDQVAEIRAGNGRQRQAQGLVARLLKKYNVEDPAAVKLVLGSEQASDVQRLTQLVEKQQEQIDELMGKKKPKEKASTAA
jgi:hypothetical protein